MTRTMLLFMALIVLLISASTVANGRGMGHASAGGANGVNPPFQTSASSPGR